MLYTETGWHETLQMLESLADEVGVDLVSYTGRLITCVNISREKYPDDKNRYLKEAAISLCEEFKCRKGAFLCQNCQN